MEVSSAESQKMQFMNLLVEQLKNQNPLEPMDNQDMAAQLAQFTQLELTEESNQNISTMTEAVSGINSSFQGAMLMAEMDYAKGFLGENVTFYSEQYGQEISGRVTKIKFQGTEPMLEVEGQYEMVNGNMSDTKTFNVPPVLVQSIDNQD